MDQKFNKAFWDACANGDFATVCAEIKKGADINYQNGDGRTALMRASKRDYKDIVRVLLDNGADVNLEDNKGKTAIMGAAKKGNKTICKKLIGDKNKSRLRRLQFLQLRLLTICLNSLASFYNLPIRFIIVIIPL